MKPPFNTTDLAVIDSIAPGTKRSIAKVPISEVIEFATEHLSPPQAMRLAAINIAFGDVPVEEFTKERVDQLVVHRRFGTEATTKTCCWTLLWAIRMFANFHMLTDYPRFAID